MSRTNKHIFRWYAKNNPFPYWRPDVTADSWWRYQRRVKIMPEELNIINPPWVKTQMWYTLCQKVFKMQDYEWCDAEPKWWRKVMHTKPRRKNNRHLCEKIQKMYPALDFLDNMVYPLDKKPHHYYW